MYNMTRPRDTNIPNEQYWEKQASLEKANLQIQIIKPMSIPTQQYGSEYSLPYFGQLDRQVQQPIYNQQPVYMQQPNFGYYMNQPVAQNNTQFNIPLGLSQMSVQPSYPMDTATVNAIREQNQKGYAAQPQQFAAVPVPTSSYSSMYSPMVNNDPTLPTVYGYNSSFGFGDAGYTSASRMAPSGVAGYYDPYYNYKMQQEAIEKEKAFKASQCGIWKRLFKGSCSFLGKECDDNSLDQFDISFGLKNIQEDEPEKECGSYEDRRKIMHKNYLKQQQREIIRMNSTQLVPFVNYQAIAFNEAICNKSETAKREIPDSVGLMEYLDNYAPKKYLEAVKNENARRHSQHLAIGGTGKGMFRDILNPNANIDDLETRISLPTNISDETRQKRRAAFIASIIGH